MMSQFWLTVEPASCPAVNIQTSHGVLYHCRHFPSTPNSLRIITPASTSRITYGKQNWVLNTKWCTSFYEGIQWTMFKPRTTQQSTGQQCWVSNTYYNQRHNHLNILHLDSEKLYAMTNDNNNIHWQSSVLGLTVLIVVSYPVFLHWTPVRPR